MLIIKLMMGPKANLVSSHLLLINNHKNAKIANIRNKIAVLINLMPAKFSLYLTFKHHNC
jgi:homoserine trans-succinylase